MVRASLYAVAAVLITCGPALANMDQIKCEKFVISVPTDIVQMAEEKAGSMSQAEQNICAAAQQFDIPSEDQEVHDIRIEPYGISTTIVIFASPD